jgi:hypothetical protein
LIEQHKESGWPADDVLASELATYRNFNPKAVEGFVKELKDTLEFAGLSDCEALQYEEETPLMPEMTPQSLTPNNVKTLTPKFDPAKASETISLPVGTEGGEIVFATVRFSAGIKRNLVASLRSLLEAMEKGLPN